jgi:hypothetical protein
VSDTEQHLRFVFATQSTGVNLFWHLYSALGAMGALGECGFFVTNRHEFSVFEQSEPGFREASLDVLKEWDLLDQAAAVAHPDLAAIHEWERSLGDASLWNALIVDRRMGFPLKAQFQQCYKPAYDHETLLKILAVAMQEIAAQLDRVRPHAVLGLNAVTVYDYLYYLMARQRGIPYMQLKLTRVHNYVSWFTNPFELSHHIVEVFSRYLTTSDVGCEDAEALEEAREFLAAAKGEHLVYEGAINRPDAKPAKRFSSSGRLNRIRAWAIRFAQALRARDPHYPTLAYSLFQVRVMRPLRRRLLRFRFDIEDVKTFTVANAGRYAIYPLNTEPEVALLAFGRPYRNQIETVRNLAAALPVGWKLVVKEHPNACGYRSTAYYRKLKQIPNVLLAGPIADTGSLIEQSGLVALVYGTIGLEAIIKQKPLLIFCEAPYGVFPPNMVCLSEQPWRLGHDIRRLLDEYRYDEAQVLAYVAAHIRTGIRVNLFTGLLGKSGRQVGEAGKPLAEQYAALASYTRQRVVEETARLARPGGEMHARR